VANWCALALIFCKKLNRSAAEVHFALTMVEVIAGKMLFLRAEIEFVPARANFTRRDMMSYVYRNDTSLKSSNVELNINNVCNLIER
jgi:hypothetical protein